MVILHSYTFSYISALFNSPVIRVPLTIINALLGATLLYISILLMSVTSRSLWKHIVEFFPMYGNK